ncbi:MAG TPA: alpha-2-macroglobulin family protein [Pyrinomonadaceae bacterium]|nr:alpha-2-macroglobulin family protein [Pyrinomonadaceae bacterium]
MKTIISITALTFLLIHSIFQQSDFNESKAAAEKVYAEGSYARANELYAKIDRTKLNPLNRRWVEFRLADSSWRSQAATQTSDSTIIDTAQKQLEELIRVSDKPEDRDLVWAEAHESLGDLFWTRENQMNWGAAWPHYQQALDWWAGQRSIDEARTRYLRIVFRAAEPPRVADYYYSGYYGNYIPITTFEDALKISTSESERSHLHFLIAMSLRYTGGDWESRQRVPDEFEEALKAGKQSPWYDDALYAYAEWMKTTGVVVQIKVGEWQQRPDFVKALELYRRLVAEFGKGETRYYDNAQQQIDNITSPTLSVAVPNVFLPQSEIQFLINARNVPAVTLSIFRVDLRPDLMLGGDTPDSSLILWLQRISLGDKRPVKSWTEKIDATEYKVTNNQIRINEKLPVGSYLLVANGSGQTARELILVSDASLVLMSESKQAAVYFANAITGAPIANANVVLWDGYQVNNFWKWKKLVQTTDQDGAAHFELTPDAASHALLAVADSDARQAFAMSSSYYVSGQADWRIYAFTDRPAYRPKETMQFKFIARRYSEGQYTTPTNQTVEYEINDPKGTKVSDGKATLNSFGSSWGSLELTDHLPLGEYNIQFWEAGRRRSIGSARLFRLEEYKLPEFKVAVKTPQENGKRKAFRLGEQVEVNLQADYYFGGPVSNANVEVVVYQKPFFQYWPRTREYPWYYEDLDFQRRGYYGDGQVIKRETIKTDATGKAVLTFDTPRENYNQDFEYRIEARVTDSSRREILSSDFVRVTRQRYYVEVRPDLMVCRPKDKLNVDFKAFDANQQPISTTGQVQINRLYRWEIWIDPTGREVQGEELQRLRARGEVPSEPNALWKRRFSGYKEESILSATVTTDSEGTGHLTFQPEKEGYYKVSWQSSQGVDARRDRFLPPVKAETSIWVATNASSDLGYRTGGVEIIVDKDTFRAGQTATVMLSVPTNDRYVLFTIEAENVLSSQLVHITGNTKLLEVPISEKHVPNIFLHAVMVTDLQLFQDTKEVVVPPAKEFLTVAVKSDREQYQAREEGTLSIKTTDYTGRPVSAEVALGLIDDSVKYIQQDYAGDPRQFYYGTKRVRQVQFRSSFEQKAYAKLVEVDGKILNEKDLARRDEDEMRPSGTLVDSLNSITKLGAADAAAPTVAEQQVMSKAERASVFAGAKNAEEPKQGEAPVQVRSDFRSTIFWQPDVTTGADGSATIKVKYPDSLTTWQATARAITVGNQVGIGDTSTRTKQPLIVRLQAPRFFVVGDQVTVSAVLNNNTDQSMRVVPGLTADGLSVTGQIIDGRSVEGAGKSVDIPANGEKRVDWVVQVRHASDARLKVEARGSKYSDAMEKSFTIFEHGIEKFVSRSGKMRTENVSVNLDLPRERKVESTRLTVQVAPSMAVTMLDSLPYLINYPYGCTEQTMSRFLPAVITVKTLRDLGLKPETAMNKIFGGIEQSAADATHPQGKHDLKELQQMTNKGLERLYDFQHADGGWGWWKDGSSDHFMTAYVLWGMTIARQGGVEVKSDVMERAAEFLDKELVEEEANYDAQSWMLHALASFHATRQQREVTKLQNTAFDNIWNNRDRLNAYTRALLALAAHNYGFNDKAKTLVENLENGVKVDSRPDTSVLQRNSRGADVSVMATAHWGEDGIYWRWSDGGVEATSFVLRALLQIDPTNKLIEPVTNWLIKNRRGAQWSNTRDTAIVVLTLNDYLRVTGEAKSAVSYDVLVNGAKIATKQITVDELLSAPSKFEISRELLKDGQNDISIVKKSGDGPLYFSAQAEFFSEEEPLTAAGNEIFVKRQYFKLVNHPTLLKGFVSERVLLNDGESVKTGDRIEMVMTVEAKNNYDYLLFEDLKPAGLEAIQITSGGNLYIRELKSGAMSGNKVETTNFSQDGDFTGRSCWVYQELRDRKVAMFVDHLPQGVWQLSYELRAESPGVFHALPVLGHAMYVPEIRTNGTEVRIKVTD